MNKKIILLIVLLAVAGVATWYFISKSKGINSAVLSIPAESSAVFTLDIRSIAEKANLSEFKNSEVVNKLFEEMGGGEESDKIKKIIEGIIADPQSTGINFMNPFAGFFEMEGRRTSAGLVMGISDDDKFTATLRSIFPEEIVFQEGADYKFIHEENDDFALAWNGKTAIFYHHKKREGTMERLDSMMNHKIEHIGKNKAFKKFNEDKGDIGFFVNYGALMRTSSEFSASGMNFPSEYYVFGNVKHEDGKMEIFTETYFEKDEDRERMDFTSSDKASEVLPYIASQKPIATANMKLDMDKLFAFLVENPDMASSMDELARMLGVTRDELKTVLSGELAIAFEGVEQREVEIMDFEGNPVPRKQMSTQVNLFIGVKNKDLLKKILAQTGLQKNADGYYDIPLYFINISLTETDKGLVLGMDPLQAKKLAASGKLSDGKFGEISDFSTSAAATLYADLDIKNLNKATREVLQESFDEEEYAIFETVMAPFQTLKSWSDGSQKSRGEITFKDASTNSLYQILKMVENVSLKAIKLEEAREERMRQMYEEDLREEDVTIEQAPNS